MSRSRTTAQSGDLELGLVNRGVNVLHVGQFGELTDVGSVDTCSRQPHDRPIRDLLAQSGFKEGTFVLAVNDSASCGQDVGWAVEGLDLPKFRELNLRQPYVAVLTPENTVEFAGSINLPLIVDLVAEARGVHTGVD